MANAAKRARPRILVIDDDPSIHRAFQLALGDIGCEVATASSGREGLDRVTGESFDLIFLDLKMPEMDGVETLRRIRQAGVTVPVYVITAFADEFMPALKAASEEGLDFELARKPLERDEIQQITRTKLGLDGDEQGGDSD